MAVSQWSFSKSFGMYSAVFESVEGLMRTKPEQTIRIHSAHALYQLVPYQILKIYR